MNGGKREMDTPDPIAVRLREGVNATDIFSLFRRNNLSVEKYPGLKPRAVGTAYGFGIHP